MNGLHKEMGISGIIFALVLEACFLGICIIYIGMGWSNLKKKKNFPETCLLMTLGGGLAAVSVYVTYLFIRG